MSLANAKAEIAEHPAKTSVTVPTDRVEQEKDVDRKLRAYAVVEAFRAGKLPSNEQIDETLRYVRDHAPIEVNKLSPDGQKLISDVRDIVETARVMVQKKNADELLQNFIHHTTQVDVEKGKVDGSIAPVSKDDAKNDARQAIQHLRTLLTLILTNSEARKLLSDASVIGRDLFARGAMKAADKARPTQEQLARVDDAAPSETWESAHGQAAGPGTKPTPQLATSGGTGITMDPNTGTTHLHTSGGHHTTAGQVFDTVRSTKEDAKATVREEAQDTARTADANGRTESEKAEIGKRSLKDKIMGGYNTLMDRVPDEHKDRAGEQYDRTKERTNEQIERTKDFLRDEFPEERRDQYIYRLKKVIVECQRHQDYTSALNWFLSTIETYFYHGKNTAHAGAGQADNIRSDPQYQRATTELRTLLERFANGKSLNGIENAARTLWDDAQNDEELRNWFRELDNFVRKTLLEPGYVMSPACSNRYDELIDSGRAFFDEKYKGHKDRLFDEVGDWFRAWGDDPLNARFSRDWKRLTKDLLFDGEGNLQFKPHLWGDIRKVILPTLIDKVGYVPIPRIEYTDKDLDLVIENLTLQGKNLFPNIVSLEAHNFIQFSPYDAIPDKHHHDFTFTFSQVQADMRDVAFYFNKKTGIPKMSDSGLADVFLGGEGLTVKVSLKSADRDRSSVFHVKDVHVKLDSLKFSVRDSKHDLLYKTLKPLATGLVKKQIAKAISDAITTSFEYIDEQLVQVRDRMAEARSTDGMSRTDVMKELFERKQEEVQSKKSDAVQKGSHFKLVSKRDSVLVNAGHESAWINKQAEKEALAHEGEGWKSKAFSIVNQPHSTTAPAPTTRAA